MEEDAGAKEEGEEDLEGEEGAGCFLSFPEAPEEEESVLPVFFFPFSLFAAGSCSEEAVPVSGEGAFPFFPLCAAVFPTFGADFAVCGAEEEEEEEGELLEAAAIGGAGTFPPVTPEEEEREDSFLAEGEEPDASPPEAGREAETDGDNDGDGEDGDGS